MNGCMSDGVERLSVISLSPNPVWNCSGFPEDLIILEAMRRKEGESTSSSRRNGLSDFPARISALPTSDISDSRGISRPVR